MKTAHSGKKMEPKTLGIEVFMGHAFAYGRGLWYIAALIY